MIWKGKGGLAGGGANRNCNLTCSRDRLSPKARGKGLTLCSSIHIHRISLSITIQAHLKAYFMEYGSVFLLSYSLLRLYTLGQTLTPLPYTGTAHLPIFRVYAVNEIETVIAFSG